ncbi:hypothetical protein PIB30_045172 [Stylosanthes scabra]|uniref:Uncharacterized protein n=1 Tax=Stylosanthes scabra TaxID=79078 RepID=A0ABU6YGI9_9FABA|nr:hypothetical protein [Stylosanthes scabra]
MRRRSWKRKQEPITEASSEDDSIVLESSVNNSVQPLEDGSSAGSEFRQENCEIQPMNVEFRPLNSDLRPDNSTIRPPKNDYPGSEDKGGPLCRRRGARNGERDVTGRGRRSRRHCNPTCCRSQPRLRRRHHP